MFILLSGLVTIFITTLFVQYYFYNYIDMFKSGGWH